MSAPRDDGGGRRGAGVGDVVDDGSRAASLRPSRRSPARWGLCNARTQEAQRVDRCFARQDWLQGACVVVSLAKAHALTGRPPLELETFVGTRVWTRKGGRYGDVPHDCGLRLGRVGP